MIDKNGKKGVVEDAVWEGKPDAPATHYTVTYHLKTRDDKIREMGLNELLPLNPK